MNNSQKYLLSSRLTESPLGYLDLSSVGTRLRIKQIKRVKTIINILSFEFPCYLNYFLLFV